jgi:hypothetical protein
MEKNLKRYAVVSSDGVVENVIVADPTFLIADKELIVLCDLCDCGVEQAGEHLQVDNTPVGIGWQYTKEHGFMLPDTPIEELKDALPSIRYTHETGGILIDGKLMPTDRETRSFLASIIGLDPAKEINVKVSGSFEKRKVGDLQSEYMKVMEHVQACFDTELEVLQIVESGSVKRIEELNNVYEEVLILLVLYYPR